MLLPTRAPALRTSRLTLAGVVPADLEDSAALWAEPTVVRHIGGKPFTREEVWSRLLRHAGLWALLGFGYWSVRETVSGRFVGQVGFADYKRDIEPPLGEAPECGWVLMPWAQGRGYAREAVEAVLDWADGPGGAARTVCFIEPDNAASVRLAGHLGYAAFAEGRYKGTPVTLFARERRGRTG